MYLSINISLKWERPFCVWVKCFFIFIFLVNVVFFQILYDMILFHFEWQFFHYYFLWFFSLKLDLHSNLKQKKNIWKQCQKIWQRSNEMSQVSVWLDKREILQKKLRKKLFFLTEREIIWSNLSQSNVVSLMG